MDDSTADKSAGDRRDEALERRRDGAAETSPTVKKTVERAAKIYFETCRKLARGISRLKSDERE